MASAEDIIKVVRIIHRPVFSGDGDSTITIVIERMVITMVLNSML